VIEVIVGRNEINPWDSRSVARWAASKVQGDARPQSLWLRITIDGPGYMLTEPEEKPQAGLWSRVALIDAEDAMRIAQGGPRGWPALCRLAEKVEGALPSRS